MEPNIDLPTLLVALVFSNGVLFFSYRRYLAKRPELGLQTKRIWIYLAVAQVFVNVVVLGLTGYLWLWFRHLMPG